MERIDLYGRLYRGALFPLWEGVLRGRPTVSRIAYLERTQHLPADELKALQLGALRRLLRHAYAHCPYYRARFDEVGVDPSGIRDLADLIKLPLLSREDVRDSLNARASTAPPFPTITKTTSGSSGKPLTIAYDTDSEDWRQAVKWRAYKWAGYRPGDRCIHYWGPQSRIASFGKRTKVKVDRLLRRETYVNCVFQSEEALANVVETLTHAPPTVIVAYARSAGNLARFINERGVRAWDTIPIICTAEQLFPQDRVEITRAFGNAVFNSYGGRETMLIAAECEAHDGLHVSTENILVEVLVTENGRHRAAEPGELGEIAVTDLHNLGSPLIRYLNGDLAIREKDGMCACGRTMERLRSLEGRKTDTFRDARGNQVHGMLLPVLMLPYAHAVQHYQAVQHVDRSITLKVVPTSAFESVRETLSKSLREAIAGVPIEIVLVDEIPFSASGKQHPVIVETA